MKQLMYSNYMMKISSALLILVIDLDQSGRPVILEEKLIQS